MTTTEPQHDPSQVVLDHVAIATRSLSDGADLFGGLLAGIGTETGDSRGFRWRQCAFPTGPKVEVLTPTDPYDGAFLERFLARSGAGPHHYNFEVPDLARTLDEVAGIGLTPVQVRLEDPEYKEAFLRPHEAHGMVIQIVQHGPRLRAKHPRRHLPQSELPHLTGIEHHVADLGAALRLFTGPLGGRVEAADPGRTGTVEVTWAYEGRIRLVEDSAVGTDGKHPAGFLHHLEFTQLGRPFPPSDRAALETAADRLGITLRLAETPPSALSGR